MEIAVNHIAKKYRGKVVLRDVSFEASDGMCIGILGSNGSGSPPFCPYWQASSGRMGGASSATARIC